MKTKKKKAQANGITFGMVVVVLVSVAIVLILTTIKIYLSNQIYYESKVVNKMKREVSALKAEKVMLEQSVEALKFKNRVTDTIFADSGRLSSMVRSFISFAVDKPIINHILMVFMILLSIFAYQNIPKEIFPPSALDKITVQGGYAGSSADVLDKMVVKTIEDDLKNISEIESLETVIQNGSFLIKANIKEGSDKSRTLDDVKDVISNVRRDLPTDMNEPTAKLVQKDFPLVIVAISGDVTTRTLLDIGNKLKSDLSRYQELSGLTVYGDVDDEVLVEINDEKINAYGLAKDSVYQAIANLSSIFPIGTLKQQGSHLYISTINGEKSAKKVESTLITVGNQRIRIGDIATVKFGLGDRGETLSF